MTLQPLPLSEEDCQCQPVERHNHGLALKQTAMQAMPCHDDTTQPLNRNLKSLYDNYGESRAMDWTILAIVAVKQGAYAALPVAVLRTSPEAEARQAFLDFQVGRPAYPRMSGLQNQL